MKKEISAPVTFRTATLADISLVSAVAAQSFRQAYLAMWETTDLEAYINRSFHPEQMRSELADPANTFILLSQGEEVAGYVKLRHQPNPPELDGQKAVQIQRFYLLAAYYGQGSGNQLMEHCLETARQMGYNAIWLAVWPENTRAVRFYQRWGFEVCGAYPFHHGEQVAMDWLMRKRLS